MRTLQSFLVFCLIVSAMAQPTGQLDNPNFQMLTQNINLFSSNFVKAVAKEQDHNLICSPLSANVALSMAAAGSAGTTEAQFKELLKYSSKATSLSGHQTLMNLLNDVKNVTLKLANKMFIAENFPLKPAYKEELQAYFYSDIDSVNFGESQKTADIINTWCKEKTNDRITSIVNADDLDAMTALVLANAVYFKGKWANEFDPRATDDLPFHINTNTVKNVPTMYRKGNYKYADLPQYDAKCIELPYANQDISMVIVLPNKIDGLAGLIEKLDEITTECNLQLSQTHKREIQLFLPKFKTESKLDLANVLSNKMGLTAPFSHDANFSGITDVPLKISKVVQKAFIEVNEEGSEAAAVTGLLVTAFSLSYAPYFNIDHPFIYTIVKTHGSTEGSVREIMPLFAGYVTNPEH